MISRQELVSKLAALNIDDTMLVDFILVLVENKKSKEYILTELLDLMNEGEAQEVVKCLFSTSGNNRLFESAMGMIQSPAQQPRQRNESSPQTNQSRMKSEKGQKQDLRSLLSKNTPTVGKKTKKSAPVITVVSTPKKPVTTTTTEITKNVTPVATNKKTMCHFGSLCSNPSCLFDHNVPTCKYYPQCLNQFCTFYHPGRKVIHPPAPANPQIQIDTSGMHLASDGMEVDITTPPTNGACKFDPYCTRKGCFYFHPSRV